MIVETQVRNSEDLLNVNRSRNINNTIKWEYNCGGYALETFNWYLPYTKDYRYKLFRGGWNNFSIEETLEICTDYMLEEFKGSLRLINDLKELQEDEYAVAFKIGGGDFHFAKRANNGHWFHKIGSQDIILRMKKVEVFGEMWCGCGNEYYSETILFAKKRIIH